MEKWKKMREKDSYWSCLWAIVWVAGIILSVFIVILACRKEVKACDFALDEGVAWVDERTYYLPAEAISEGPEASKWVAFRGANGMVYEVNDEILGQIGGSDGLDTDGIYLLTMGSNGTKEWYDDTILVVWRDVL